jgi:hypothetical protein
VAVQPDPLAGGADVGATVGERLPNGWTVYGPKGLRIEGLTRDGLAQLWRMLGSDSGS